MVILFTKNGLPWPHLYPYLVISMAGTGKSSEALRIVSVASTSQFPVLMVNQGSNICPNIKLTSRDPMVRRKTEIRFGQDMLFKTKKQLSMIVSFGTLKRISNGQIHHQLRFPSRVTGFMKLTLAWPKSSEESVLTETSPITTLIESRTQDIM